MSIKVLIRTIKSKTRGDIYSEQVKRRDQIEDKSLSHHRGREDVYHRGNQISNEERRSRQEKPIKQCSLIKKPIKQNMVRREVEYTMIALLLFLITKGCRIKNLKRIRGRTETQRVLITVLWAFPRGIKYTSGQRIRLA